VILLLVAIFNVHTTGVARRIIEGNIRTFKGVLIMAKLDSDQVTEKLKALPGWDRKGEAIAKQYTFKGFMDGIRFLNRIAEIAEGMDHHPDVTINYKRITFTLSTHDQGGITEKDIKLAESIEKEFKASGQG
jgi:4a-hydroxytetrahydrobiopterin dehydratase